MKIETYDVLIVGGGQYGLACGLELQKLGKSFVIIEKHKRIGDVWRKRPKNLKLFTSRKSNQISNFEFPGEPWDFPSSFEFADYLENISKSLSSHIKTDTTVTHLAQSQFLFNATLSNGETVEAKTVINASGAYQKVIRPQYSQELPVSVDQINSTEYSEALDVKNYNSILIVGDGATGRQIALEIKKYYNNEIEVHLSCGKKRRTLPNPLLGRDIFYWLNFLNILYLDKGSFIAGLIKKSEPIPHSGTSLSELKKSGVKITSRTIKASAEGVHFQSNDVLMPNLIIWCTSPTPNQDWHEGVNTNTPGYFVIGQKWLSCRASDLILGIKKDVPILIQSINQYLEKDLCQKQLFNKKNSCPHSVSIS